MEWQPIETARRDGTRVLLWLPTAFNGGYIIAGEWDDDRYSNKPRPYWSNDRCRGVGKSWARENQPTHWMLLPAPPSAPTKGE